MRKLASVRKVLDVNPIVGADLIESATVDGWKVVVKKGDFKVGDLAVYFEIDSWIPNEIAPFLTSPGKEPKEYKGIRGQRLRTVKLRGQLSQGLLISLKDLKLTGSGVEEGQDLTSLLGIEKWEREVDHGGRNSSVKGHGWTAASFPTHLFPKTDQDRIQNVFHQRPKDHLYEKTVKLDGSSCSIFRHEGKLRVCSRNLELDIIEKSDNKLFTFVKRLFGFKVKVRNIESNHFVAMAYKNRNKIPEGYCFQGELCGPTIQNNYEKLKENCWYVYDVIELKTRRYLNASERRELVKSVGLKHVPVIDYFASYPSSVEEALEEADRTPSMNRKDAEGIVYKSVKDPSLSFKVISNNYLLKEKE